MITTSVVLKNAISTAIYSAFIAVPVAMLPAGFSLDAFLWGCIGGIARPLALKERWQMWPASIIVGGITASWLDGSKVPWISDLMVKSTSPQFQPFIIGTCGILIIGTIYDLAKKTKLKIGGPDNERN